MRLASEGAGTWEVLIINNTALLIEVYWAFDTALSYFGRWLLLLWSGRVLRSRVVFLCFALLSLLGSVFVEVA